MMMNYQKLWYDFKERPVDILTMTPSESSPKEEIPIESITKERMVKKFESNSILREVTDEADADEALCHLLPFTMTLKRMKKSRI